MLTVFSIIFTLIFIFLILHLLYFTEDKKLDKEKANRIEKEKSLKAQTLDPRKVYGREWDSKVPRPRICPACGSFLEKHEYLFASMQKGDGEKNIVHIYGCRYCYLGVDRSINKPEESIKEEKVEELDF